MWYISGFKILEKANTETNAEIIDKIQHMVIDDRNKLREIVSAVDTSNEQVHNILNQRLDMERVSARLVPWLLSIDQKITPVKCWKHGLQIYQRNLQEFKHRFINVGETWIHHYSPETKERSKP